MLCKENFVSRLGFIMTVAGCAIGLGNVWRFPFIAGMSGGAIFVLFYLFFLLLLGIPVLMIELSIGRAAECSPVKAFTKLVPNRRSWKYMGYLSLLGSLLLMSFYSVITGWLLYYFGHLIQGEFVNLSTEQIQTKFAKLLSNPYDQLWCALATIFVSCLV